MRGSCNVAKAIVGTASSGRRVRLKGITKPPTERSAYHVEASFGLIVFDLDDCEIRREIRISTGSSMAH